MTPTHQDGGEMKKKPEWLEKLPPCKLCGSNAAEAFASSEARYWVCCGKEDGRCRMTTTQFPIEDWTILCDPIPQDGGDSPTDAHGGLALVKSELEKILYCCPENWVKASASYALAALKTQDHAEILELVRQIEHGETDCDHKGCDSIAREIRYKLEALPTTDRQKGEQLNG